MCLLQFRARLFSLLSKVHPGAQLSLVLRQGLEDTTTAVRRECESMLQTFARSKNGAATTVALLSFVGQLLESSGDAVFNELSAEKALHCLLASADWCVVSEESIHSLLHSEELSAEQAVVGRVALALDAEVWSLDKTLCGTGLLRKTLQALDRGDEFMLRQLLLVLLYSEVRDSDRTLLHVATGHSVAGSSEFTGYSGNFGFSPGFCATLLSKYFPSSSSIGTPLAGTHLPSFQEQGE